MNTEIKRTIAALVIEWDGKFETFQKIQPIEEAVKPSEILEAGELLLHLELNRVIIVPVGHLIVKDQSGTVYCVSKNEFDMYFVKEKLTYHFEWALQHLRHGFKVARYGWNGKGMYLILVQGYPVNGHLNAASCSDDENEPPCLSVPELNPDGSKNITQGKAGQMLSHIVLKTAGDSQYWGEGFSDYVPYTPSQTDILSDDWLIVE